MWEKIWQREHLKKWSDPNWKFCEWLDGSIGKSVSRQHFSSQLFSNHSFVIEIAWVEMWLGTGGGTGKENCMLNICIYVSSTMTERPVGLYASLSLHIRETE